MNDEGDDGPILMVSEKNGVWEWLQQNTSKLAVNRSVNLAVLLDMGKVRVKYGEKAVP